eukprot:3340587-Rhodomonas_salina.1
MHDRSLRRCAFAEEVAHLHASLGLGKGVVIGSSDHVHHQKHRVDPLLHPNVLAEARDDPGANKLHHTRLHMPSRHPLANYALQKRNLRY